MLILVEPGALPDHLVKPTTSFPVVGAARPRAVPTIRTHSPFAPEEVRLALTVEQSALTSQGLAPHRPVTPVIPIVERCCQPEAKASLAGGRPPEDVLV
jgi:hypothetical protein